MKAKDAALLSFSDSALAKPAGLRQSRRISPNNSSARHSRAGGNPAKEHPASRQNSTEVVGPTLSLSFLKTKAKDVAALLSFSDPVIAKPVGLRKSRQINMRF
jgi:hypothetical protein